MAPEGNTSFLSTALTQIAKQAQASLVLFGEYLDLPLPRVRTLCCIHQGELIDNFSFCIAGDPAEHARRNGSFGIAENARQAFPESLLLRDFHIESCTALVFALGANRTGIVAALNETPATQDALVLSKLRAFTQHFAHDTPMLEVERERARYASFVHDEFFREFVLDNQEAFHFAEFMPPVPLDLPEPELLERLMHTAHVIESNRAMAHLYGYPDVEAYLGATPYDVNGPERAPRMVKYWMQSGYHLRDVESQGVDANGEVTWVRGTVVGHIRQGKLTHCWARRSDITDRKRYETAIQHKAHHDALTALPNRYWFQEQLSALIADHASRNKRFCIGLLDLNGFKEINDTLGHTVGDLILQAVAKRLLKGLKAHDAQIARLGGDEFAIVLPEVNNLERAETMTSSLQRLLNEHFLVENMHLSIGGSLGLAMFPDHSDDGDDLLRMADVAMYAAKREGIACCWYRPDLDHHSLRRLSLLTELGPALERGELTLDYQPIVDLWNKQLYGFEALLRWRHPKHGLIPPGDFIPFAETSEIIRPLTRWVLAAAIRQGTEWRAQGHVLKISVNISARNLHDENLGPFIAECLAGHDFPPAALEIEVTESALMTRPAHAMQILQSLRAMGVTIAIDDFGTGYSSLAYLARLPVNTLKVDQSFVRGMLHSRTDEQIVRSVVGLAHECQLKVVAEGVEDERTFDALNNMGCDLAQGFLMARPMSAAAAAKWIRDNRASG